MQVHKRRVGLFAINVERKMGGIQMKSRDRFTELNGGGGGTKWIDVHQ